MKRFVVLCIILSLCFSVIGCGKRETTNNNVDDEEAIIEKRVLRIGTTTAPGSHFVKGLEVFKENIDKNTNGQVELQIYHSGQLGNERDLIEGVGTGTIEMCITSTGPLSNFSPDFLVFDFPYIITDRDVAFRHLDGDVGQEIIESLERSGIKGLGFWENGFRHVTNDKKPIVHPTDMKGFKIRTMENPIHMAAFKSIGAIPTPMAWGEVFTGLQQGTIDGQENPLANIDADKTYEVQKHISLTSHLYSPALVMINKDLFEGLPEDVCEALVKAEKEARDWERNYCRELDDKLVKDLRERGNIVTEVDLEEWKSATKVVYEQFKDKVKQKHMEALTGSN